MQIHNAIITGSFSYNGADLSNVTSSNAYSASLSSRTTDLESTSSVLVGASSSFSSRLSSVSSSQQQLSSSFLTLTASFNAVSASQQQISSSYIALSASYNTFSGSNSTILTAVSSSQQQISASLLNVIAIGATTGSNSFRANQSITGSLVVSSTITAQTLVVQTVTSSILYSSGSNIFGCDLNSRQTFTGSVLITGSLNTAGTISGTTIYGSTAVCSAVGKFTSCIDAGSGTFSSSVTAKGTLTLGDIGVTNAIINSNDGMYFNIDADASGGSPEFMFGKGRSGAGSGGTTFFAITCTGAATFTGNITVDKSSPVININPPSGTSGQYNINNGVGSLMWAMYTTTGGSNAQGNWMLYSAGKTGGAGNIIDITPAGVATFSSTIAGTTIYGSTAVCSPVGLFSGCVGIGTTDPYTKLQVNSGNISVLSSCSIGTDGAGDVRKVGFGFKHPDNTVISALINTTAAGTWGLNLHFNVRGGNAVMPTIPAITIVGADDAGNNGGLVGIGTCSPSRKLHIFNNNDTRGILIHNCSTTSYAELHFCASREFRIGTGGTAADSPACNKFYVYDATSSTHRFTIDCTGRIGIGITTPSELLHVCGNIRAGNTDAGVNYTSSPYIGIAGTGGQSPLFIAHASGYGLAYFGYDACGDRLIIATDNGAGNNKIDFSVNAGTDANANNVCGITTAMRITSGGDVNLYSTYNVERYRNFYNGIYQVSAVSSINHPSYNDAGYLNFSTAKTSSAGFTMKMTIAPNGNIGVTTDGTQIYNPSDIRLKRNIETITYGLDKVLALNPVKYNWISGFSQSEENKTLLGFIAQEVQALIPEAVESFSDGGTIIIGDTVIENPLRVSEKFIIPILVKSIQEQQCTICTQASMINTLKTCLGII